MEKDPNFSGALPGNFSGGDYSLDHHHQQFMKPRTGESSNDNNNNQIVDYMINNPLSPPPRPQQQQHISSSGFCTSTNSFDKLNFANVMQFADFGPKLALNQSKTTEEEAGIDPVFFLKFPVLNEKLQDDQADDQSLMVHHQGNDEERFKGVVMENKGRLMMEGEGEREDVEARVNSEGNTSMQIQFLGEDIHTQKSPALVEGKNKRKRPRTTKTSEEVESQRMTHIAVERNRRKQMNEHLRVLRSLMPGSYVQRGDQASIIGGAIEFVRELEQLLQCLESQKRRRIYGDAPRPMGDASNAMQQAQPPFLVPDDPVKLVEFETGLREEIAESKSCLADVEVRVLGFDAMIKILCRRRPGQLIKTIAALEELELNILHTNITTIEQTVLYSFNVKVSSESRFTADDIANSVQQIFSYIHANM